jgi:hypothetical protein
VKQTVCVFVDSLESYGTLVAPLFDFLAQAPPPSLPSCLFSVVAEWTGQGPVRTKFETLMTTNLKKEIDAVKRNITTLTRKHTHTHTHTF